jgi:DNA-directed RNA polymerase beta subunit
MTNSRVEIPYAYKLLAQELQTINIVPRIITEPNNTAYCCCL